MRSGLQACASLLWSCRTRTASNEALAQAGGIKTRSRVLPCRVAADHTCGQGAEGRQHMSDGVRRQRDCDTLLVALG
eukprot:scaffold227966_cov33-Tisochrysis_lutea.AAC.3